MTQIRQLARSTAVRLAPGYMADRARRHERELRSSQGVTGLAERMLAGGEPVVQAGPFAGMVYPDGRLHEVDAPGAKLLGTYECEIAWVFERAILRRVPAFIDIGCADGYYAVGMAHASPETVTFAYDLSSSARELCTATAAVSGVLGRVRVAERFTTQEAQNLLREALVLCDIEGGEVELFDSALAQALAASVVVIEVHEDDRPGARSRLLEVFADTHQAVTVPQQPRADILDAVADWSPQDRASLLGEFRGPHLHWIVFEPKRG